MSVFRCGLNRGAGLAGPVLAGIALTVAFGCAHTPDPLELIPPELVERDLLPREIQGWKALGEDSVYDADTLFDYINGGAELYRAFNVRRVVARPFEKEGAPDIYADVYDMETAKDAYGVYHHELRSGESVGIGQESEYAKGSLAFWKERYFVSIMALKETQESKAVVLALGKSVAGAIPREGHPPIIVGMLPQEGLVNESVRFFHTHTMLNNYFPLSEENILSLGPHTEGVLARYAPAEEGAPPNTLLMVHYGRPPRAEAMRAGLGEERPPRAEDVLPGFLEAYLPGADADGMAKRENERWAGARVMGGLLIAVLDAPTKEVVAAMLEQAVKAAEANRPSRREFQ
jgi:Family of unknown function (DUF6599)